MGTPTNKNVLVDRDKFLGGSEISTIMNINNFQTRFELLLIKAGWNKDEQVDNPYVDFGSKMECHIREYINDTTEYNFLEDTIIKEDEQNILNYRCNYDGLDVANKINLEIKTTSQVHKDVRQYKYYIVQLLYGMMLADIDKGILAVYKRNEDMQLNFEPERLQIFYINKEDFSDWVEEIEVSIADFFIDLQKVIDNPFITEYELRPQLPSELQTKMQEIEMLNIEYQEAKKVVERFEEFKKELFNQMEKYNVKKWDTEKGLKFTCVDSTPTRTDIVEEFDLDSFKSENEELYKKYLVKKEKTIKGKKGYVKVLC